MSKESEVIIAKARAVQDFEALDKGVDSWDEEAYLAFTEDGMRAAHAEALTRGIESEPQTPIRPSPNKDD